MNSIEELSGINLIDTEDKSDCTTPICACQEKEPENEENYQYTELDKLFENIQKEVHPSQLSYKADWFRMFVESVLTERDFFSWFFSFSPRYADRSAVNKIISHHCRFVNAVL